MTAMETYKRFWQKAFVTKGRARRKEYWIPTLFNAIISAIIIGLTVALFEGGKEYAPDDWLSPSNIAANIFTLIILIPSFTVTMRRLQDININGLWAFAPMIFSVLLIIGFFGGLLVLSGANAVLPFGIIILLAVIYVVMQIVFFIFSIMDGTRGPNNYGPDPKGR